MGSTRDWINIATFGLGGTLVDGLRGLYNLSLQKGVAPTVTNMQPSSLDAFQITKVEEGSCVPIIYGRVKLTGNIIWYGGLAAFPNYETQVSQVQDGKSTKTVHQEFVASYTYYLSMWQLLCQGPATMIKTFVNDTEQDIPIDDLQISYAEGRTAPLNSTIDTFGNAVITPLEGVAWVYMNALRLGTNTTSVQSLHFLMESIPTAIMIGDNT